MSDPYLGEIRMVGFNYAPRGWALCNGQLLSIAQNSALFALLGTQFGGNGVQTFGLPDLRGRVPVHQGSGPGLTPRVMGEMAGEETVTLNTSQMPQHNHIVNASSSDASASSPSGNYNAASTDPNTLDPVNSYTTNANVTMNPSAIANAGGNQPHDNTQPYLVVNFIIALQGIFPSRN